MFKAQLLTDCAATGADFFEVARSVQHWLYVIDLGLPDCNGLQIILSLRAQRNTTPILVVSGRSKVADRVQALNAGADDYLVKPFHHDEFVARILALLRRPTVLTQDEVRYGQLVADGRTGEASCNGVRMELRPSERKLLVMLLRKPGEVFTRQTIIDALVDRNTDVTPNAVDQLMSRLRRKLGEIPTGLRLRTVRGDGYVLEAVAQ